MGSVPLAGCHTYHTRHQGHRLLFSGRQGPDWPCTSHSCLALTCCNHLNQVPWTPHLTQARSPEFPLVRGSHTLHGMASLNFLNFLSRASLSSSQHSLAPQIGSPQEPVQAQPPLHLL